MEEIEVPLEKLQEDLHEHAHHATEKWIGRVALSSALLAVCAAVAALLAGHHSNEAMILQIQASDHWSYFQAKGIKSAILQSKQQVLQGLGKDSSAQDQEKIEEYKKEQEEISEKAKDKEKESEHHLLHHQTLAKAVTLFQVAIAISAISVLVRRRYFWYVSLLFGASGIFFFIWGLI